MKRLLVLTVYPTFRAGTRLRADQYRPYFEQQGFSTTLWTFLREGDMEGWFQGSISDRLRIVARSMLRIFSVPELIERSDVVLVQREILPFGPPVLQRLAAWMRPLIWDVGDAVWKSGRSYYLPWVPTWIRRSSSKFEQICGIAGQVWAATAVIEDWCSQFSNSVWVVPTVVDVRGARPPRAQGPIVGWIGAPPTSQFLESILPAIEGVQPPPEVLVLGTGISGHYGIPISAAPWTPDREVETLERMSVGLYPIDRSHPLDEGKPALKTILYMSQGIPAVVTPTTTNALVVTDGVEGLHAETLQDWIAQVQRLLTETDLWENCSIASHARAIADFSLQRWGPEVAGHLNDAVKAAR